MLLCFQNLLRIFFLGFKTTLQINLDLRKANPSICVSLKGYPSLSGPRQCATSYFLFDHNEVKIATSISWTAT